MKPVKYPMTIAVLLIFLGLPFLLVPPSAQGADQAQKNNADGPVFHAEGLNFEKLLTDIYRGDFLDIPFDRDEQLFVLLLNSYITTYASDCTKFLPSNSIELTRQRCTSWDVYTNGYGVETRRECTNWVKEGTNQFAAPEMHKAKTVIENLQSADTFRNLWRMMNEEDPIGNAASTLGNLQAAQADMIALLRMNDCDSPGLMRFQENLRRFAMNDQPIRPGGESKDKSNKGLIARDQNFNKLVDDLVLEHSKKWVMNKYQRGSVSNVSIHSLDSQDRASEVRANYSYQGWSGNKTGSVRVTFSQGMPECLYFADFPFSCRTADRRIVAGYAEGSYQNSD